MPGLAHFLVTTPSATSHRLRSPPRVGGAFALAVGLPLMRLSGLAAGIATFAVLGITNNVLTHEQKIGPGLNAFSGVPHDDRDVAGGDRGAHLRDRRLRLPAHPLWPDASSDA